MSCSWSQRKRQARIQSLGLATPKPSFHSTQLSSCSHTALPALSFRHVFGKSRKITQVLASRLNGEWGDSPEFTHPQAPPGSCYLHPSLCQCALRQALCKRWVSEAGREEARQTGCNKAQMVCLRGRSSINPEAPVRVTFLKLKLPLALALHGMRQEIRGDEEKALFWLSGEGRAPSMTSGRLASGQTVRWEKFVLTVCVCVGGEPASLYKCALTRSC